MLKETLNLYYRRAPRKYTTEAVHFVDTSYDIEIGADVTVRITGRYSYVPNTLSVLHGIFEVSTRNLNGIL